MFVAAELPSYEDRDWLGLSWLVRLRWGAVAGALLAAAIAAGFDRALPWMALLAWIGLAAASNVAASVLARRSATPGRAASGTLLVFDSLILTGVLFFTGGAHNPFSILYLVHIALAAVVLGPAWTWALTALAVSSYGLLFRFYRPLEAVGEHAAHGGYDLHLRGMWLAFVVSALLIAYFGARLAQALERREGQLQAAELRAARDQRLASLATLSAGAAHELGTPLATIAVVAGELERSAERLHGAGALADDARLIQAQLARCRRILDDMAAEAGEPAGEEARGLSLEQLGRSVLAQLAPDDARRVQVDLTPADQMVSVPAKAVGRALMGLVRNALDASGADASVSLTLTVERNSLRAEVEDRGAGMPPEVLARAGEPFFTTKPPGRGLGLGLFLTRSVAERLEGSLNLSSHPGVGTRAVLVLPVPASGEPRA